MAWLLGAWWGVTWFLLSEYLLDYLTRKKMELIEKRNPELAAEFKKAFEYSVDPVGIVRSQMKKNHCDLEPAMRLAIDDLRREQAGAETRFRRNAARLEQLFQRPILLWIVTTAAFITIYAVKQMLFR
jgi:hypothetical protein